jgi:hypothetical protein
MGKKENVIYGRIKPKHRYIRTIRLEGCMMIITIE